MCDGGKTVTSLERFNQVKSDVIKSIENIRCCFPTRVESVKEQKLIEYKLGGFVVK